MKAGRQRRGRDNIGLRAEQQACSYLADRGYKVIGRNFRSRYGEIDIIANHESTLVFVEVRYRRHGSLVTPSESVNWTKIKRLRLAIRDFLSRHHGLVCDGDSIRVDLCCVSGPGDACEEAHEFDFELLKGIIHF